MAVLLDGIMKKIDNDFACVAPSVMEVDIYDYLF